MFSSRARKKQESTQELTNTKAKGGEIMANTVLQVEGMSCNHCKMSVEKALKTLDGVNNAAVDLAAKTVTIDHDPSVASETSLKQAISDAGYEVK